MLPLLPIRFLLLAAKNGGKPKTRGEGVQLFRIYSRRSIYSTCVSGPGEVSHYITRANNSILILGVFSALIEVKLSTAGRCFFSAAGLWRVLEPVEGGGSQQPHQYRDLVHITGAITSDETLPKEQIRQAHSC